jgi:transcriptional regulator with XRE-family HTH domain
MPLGMTLTAYLREHGITHADFAARIGATQAAVSRYANGTRKPSLDKIIPIESVTEGAVRAIDFATVPFIAEPDLAGDEERTRAKPLRCFAPHGIDLSTEGQSR